MKNNTIIIAVVTLLVGAGAGFFGGMKYQQSRRTAGFAQFAGGQGRTGLGTTRSGNGSQAGNFRPVTGSITSVDDKSATVKMADGSSKIVILSDSTKITKGTDASKSDLKIGENIMVTGTTNSDGSVTAQNIQLNPQEFRGGPNTPGTTGAAQP
jgi:hypothetical protein